MEKRIIISGRRKRVLSLFQAQLHSILGRDLNILAVVHGDPILNQLHTGDVLLTSVCDMDQIPSPLPSGVSVISLSVTFQSEGLNLLRRHPDSQEVIVAEDTIQQSSLLIMNLLQFGITQLQLIPADLSDPSRFQDKTVLICQTEAHEVDGAREIIDLKLPVLDMTSILDVALELGRKELLTKKNIRRSFLHFTPIHKGLSWALETFNGHTGTKEILLEITDGAVIGIGQSGRVQFCNDRAYSIFDIRPRDIQGKNGIELFPQIPFRKVLDEGITINEALTVIRDENMILTVKPVLNSGKRYGAVALVKRFHDEECRHNNLRTRLNSRGCRAKYHFEDILGDSNAMAQCISIAKRMASSSSSLLITGESGTGKEMFAQAIHNASPRKSHQFVALNCGAIPENLLESELFGYEEGAFTGAKKGGKPGMFELAHKGTLFLDEISEMHLTLQKRLLRVLQEREVMRLGGDCVIPVDVRIISATNRDLRIMVREGSFREDLYYRLSVLPLSIPPLRKRLGDLPLLIGFFRNQLNAVFTLNESVLAVMEAHHWPGNVRELENYMEYFSNLGTADITTADLTAVLPVETLQQLPSHLSRVSVPTDEISASADGISVSTDETSASANGISVSDPRILFILQTLEESFRTGRRRGRRSISHLAQQSGIFLSEQETRHLLLMLQEKGLVHIHPTKAGTVITPEGLVFLKNNQ